MSRSAMVDVVHLGTIRNTREEEKGYDGPCTTDLGDERAESDKNEYSDVFSMQSGTDVEFSKTIRSRHSHATEELEISQAHIIQQNSNNNQPETSRNHRSEIATYFNICAFALLGCAIRVGLDRGLGEDGLGIENSDYIIFQSFLANMLGSFILGAVTGSNLKGIDKMLPVFTGISTGLCGSITTFSKFNQQVSLMIVGEAEPVGNRFFTAFLSILLGFSAPISSFVLGHDISFEIREVIRERDDTDPERQTNSETCTSVSKALNYTFAVFFIVCWIPLLVCSIVYLGVYNVVFTCLSIALAPIGAILRFLLSKLNKRQCKFSFIKEVPLGTFIANLIGSVILACINVALTWSDLPCSSVAILQSVGTGFCACLTTVSTLVSEILGMRKQGKIAQSHFYPFFTIFLCQAAACMINGISYTIYKNGVRSLSNSTCP